MTTTAKQKLNETLNHSQIAEAVNNNKPMSSFLSTYLHGNRKLSFTKQLSALDIQKALNSPLAPVFKRMFIAAVTVYEKIKENIRATIRLTTNEELQKQEKNAHLDEETNEDPAWFSIDNDAPKLQLTPAKQSKADVSEKLVEVRSMLPVLIAALTGLFGKFFLIITGHRKQYQELANRPNHRLTFFNQVHARNFFDTYNDYHQSTDPQHRHGILHHFALLHGPRPEPKVLENRIERLHRFFKSPDVRNTTELHRAEIGAVSSEVSRSMGEIIYYQQNSIRLNSPLNYQMNEMFMRNPNFEYTPKPGNGKSPVQQEANHQNSFNMNPFEMDLQRD